MLNELLKRPLIPVIIIEDAENAIPLAEALLKGGIDIIEITFRTAAATESIRRIAKELPDMLIGAGTLLSPEQGLQAIDAGARFGLAPGINPKVVKSFRAAGGLFIPGVMTPSEIEQGLALDCKLLKFFPAVAAGGPKMLQALAAPFASQSVKFCPTGGITLENMNEFLALPMVSNVGGTWLATQQQISEKNWGQISRQAAEALSKINQRSG